MPSLGHVDAADRRTGGSLSLPVLTDSSGLGRPARRSRIARWRAAALIGVYVVMAAHLVHWQVAGKTLAPTVLSDSMQTLEVGKVNPGFVLFVIALLATALLGRFFCGWACHMGALQDGCAWLLRRAGIRPQIFRARLLGYIPLALAVYMFVWPTLKREAILPALARWWPEGLGLLQPVAPFPGFTTRFVADDLWAGLPGPAVAVAFLLICGVATVYFLGARGLCRYACPYGGFLLPVERVAPGRIVVDAARCDGCGHCTAACTSGVRVYEEVRSFGKVMSRDCIRSLDCISVCPQGALSFGFVAPGGAKGREAAAPKSARHDLSWPEEVFVLGVFVLTFFSVRGVYGVVPMLMAAGIGVCTAFAAWLLWRMVRARDLRFSGAQLKRAGRWRPAGLVAGAGVSALLVLVLQCAAVRFYRWRGDVLDARVNVPAEVVFSGRRDQIPEEARRDAAQAVEFYRLGSSWRRGGLGLANTTAIETRCAWLHLVLGEPAESEAAMRRAINRNGPSDSLCHELSRIMLLAGRFDGAVEYLRGVHGSHPRFTMVRAQLCNLYLGSGRAEEAAEICRRAIQRRPDDAGARTTLATVLFSRGDVAGSLEELRLAAASAPRDAHVLTGLAEVSFAAGLVDDATGALSRAAEADPGSRPMYLARGAEMLSEAGRETEAAAWRARAEAGAAAR